MTDYRITAERTITSLQDRRLALRAGTTVTLPRARAGNACRHVYTLRILPAAAARNNPEC